MQDHTTTTPLQPIATSQSSHNDHPNDGNVSEHIEPASKSSSQTNPTPSDGVLSGGGNDNTKTKRPPQHEQERESTNTHKLTDSKFWRRQISIVTGQEACRDHFANERTFLGYLRTSSAFATLGVVSVQLFILGDPQSNCKAPYGKGLALVCVGVAIAVALSGAYRFWRHQNAILRGKICAGGWEVNVIGACGFIVTVLTLVLVLLGDCD